MLEPDSAANIVPPATAMYESRPGTRPKTLSRVENIRSAMPLWKNNSPMRMNSGTGIRRKFEIDRVALLIICSMPAGPPIKTIAPTTLAIRKANATGMLRAMSATTRPSIRRPAAYHSVNNPENHSMSEAPSARFVLGQHRIRPKQVAGKFDRQQEERQRYRCGDNPSGHGEGSYVLEATDVL